MTYPHGVFRMTRINLKPFPDDSSDSQGIESIKHDLACVDSIVHQMDYPLYDVDGHEMPWDWKAATAAETVAAKAARSADKAADVSLSANYVKLQAVFHGFLGINEGQKAFENWYQKDMEKAVKKCLIALLQTEIKRIIQGRIQEERRDKCPVLKCGNVPRQHEIWWKRGLYLSEDRKSLYAVLYEDGFCHCHNVHVCPYCAPAIGKFRRNQVRELIYRAKKQDYECYLLTLTFSHDSEDTLLELLPKMAKASTDLWQDWKIKDMFDEKKDTCYFVHNGRVTVLEIMWGKNGPHPHFHILIIGKKGIPIKDIKDIFTEKWLQMLKQNGLEGLEGIAADFEACKNIKDYLVKIPCEMTSSKTKDGRFPHHLNFFQLLEKCALAPNGQRKRKMESQLWDYYQATFGKHFLQFGRGLLDRFEIRDITDEEIIMEGMEGKDKEDIKQYGLSYKFDTDEYMQMTREERQFAMYLAESFKDEELNAFLDSRGVHYEITIDRHGKTGDWETDARIEFIRRRKKGDFTSALPFVRSDHK